MVELLNDLHVGVALFNKQHAELINMLILFREELKKGISKSRTLPMIELLVEKTRIHLDSEEELMFEVGYPGAEAHKNTHDSLIKHMLNFKRDYNRGLLDVNLEDAIEDFRLWMLMHIKTKDKSYNTFLKENGYS